MIVYQASEDVAVDAILWIKLIATEINHEPVAELHLGHEAVLQLLSIANEIHEKETDDDDEASVSSLH